MCDKVSVCVVYSLACSTPEPLATFSLPQYMKGQKVQICTPMLAIIVVVCAAVLRVLTLQYIVRVKYLGAHYLELRCGPLEAS